MQRIIKLFLISLFFFIATYTFATQLNVATSEWVPYVGKQLSKQGLAIDIVNTALQRAGYQPVVTIDVWSRTLQGADVGVYDLIAAAWYNEKRAQHFTFSKPYLYNEIKLLKHVDSDFQYNSIADLNGRMVGVINNYAYGENFSQAKGMLRIPGTQVLENILRVLNREIELTLDDERVLKYQIKHNIDTNKDKLVIIPKSLSKNGLYIAVSKKNPKHKEIAQAFDKAIAGMKKDGTFERILKAHLND